MSNSELVLAGCSPTPLINYLKALGILRLLGEQKSEWKIRGAWREEIFVLAGPVFSGDEKADRATIRDYFLNEYRPTPVIAPWNGGSGFYPKDKAAAKAINAILANKNERFAEYRAAIKLGQRLVREFQLKERPENDVKADFIKRIRSTASDTMLAWVDAAIVIASEDILRFPPLLGTGGNDGRLDFTGNFMQRIVEILIDSVAPDIVKTGLLLDGALFDRSMAAMSCSAIGQFDPGGVGGPNSTVGYEGDSLTNPWDFVLAIEGAVLFSAAATRRLESAQAGMLTYPFTVRSTIAGGGSVEESDQASARHEIWLPVWESPASFVELKALFSEGRSTLGRRQSRDGLTFVRSIATLGIDRGIGSFQRYGFLKRSGKAYIATPLSRIEVRRNVDADMISELDRFHFLDKTIQFSHEEQSSIAYRVAVKSLQRRLFEYAQKSDATVLQQIIISLGKIFSVASKSHKAQEVLPVLYDLSESWVEKANDGSVEFRLAAALAGLTIHRLPILNFVLPVEKKDQTLLWKRDSGNAVWGGGDLSSGITNAIRRGLILRERSDFSGSVFESRFGVSSRDILACLRGSVNERRILELFFGLIHMRIPMRFPGPERGGSLPAIYSILKPFFMPSSMLVKHQYISAEKEGNLQRTGELVQRLLMNDMEGAASWAWRRLKNAGYSLPSHPAGHPDPLNISGNRLLLALAIPLNHHETMRCLSSFTSEINHGEDIKNTKR